MNTSNPKLCRHFIIGGRVQGVWFRNGTFEKANKLGVTGWVKNRSDGQVEVVACAPEDLLNRFHAWLIHGPETATVSSVAQEEIPWQEHKSFVIRHD